MEARHSIKDRLKIFDKQFNQKIENKGIKLEFVGDSIKVTSEAPKNETPIINETLSVESEILTSTNIEYLISNVENLTKIEDTDTYYISADLYSNCEICLNELPSSDALSTISRTVLVKNKILESREETNLGSIIRFIT